MHTLYCALDDRLLVVREADWLAHERHTGDSLECVSASPERPERVFVGTVSEGLAYSTDGGDSWTTSLGTDDRVTAVAVSPHDPDVVWAGTEPSRVYRSTDGGDTWTERPGLQDLPSSSQWSFPPRPHTHHVRWLAVDPHEQGRLYVAIEAGAFVRTDDGGETWQDHPTGARRDNHTLATHPDAPGRVYTAAGDGYAESTDGGDSWDRPQEGLDHRYCWSVAPDPSDSDTVVLSSAGGPRQAHSQPAESSVYRREGDGPWTRAMDGLPDPEGSLRAVLAPGDEAGELFLLSNHGLHRTGDAGRTWARLAVSWREAYETQRPRGLAVV